MGRVSNRTSEENMKQEVIKWLMEATPVHLAILAVILAMVVLGLAMRAIIILVKERK
jgi:hypothetical protein